MLDETVIIGVIIAIVEMAKRSGLDSKYAPFVSIALGILYGISLGSMSLGENVIMGIILGLSASGLYSGTVRQFRD